MADQNTIVKVKELLEGHCYQPLKEAAERWLEFADEKCDVKEKAAKAKDVFDDAVDSVREKADPALEKLAETELIKQLKEGIATLAENIELFSTDKGAELVGSKETASQIKAHAEAMKAEGKEFCDCAACTKARDILKDLGEDVEE